MHLYLEVRDLSTVCSEGMSIFAQRTTDELGWRIHVEENISYFSLLGQFLCVCVSVV